jgi:hypothetical protein
MHKEESENLEALVASERAGHETRDLPVGAFGTGMLWFTGLFVLSLVAGWVFLWALPGVHTEARPVPPGELPPSPVLQTDVTAKTDIQDLRREEARRMTSYAYVDRAAGTVRVPIDVAIDMTVRKGLPIQGRAPAPAAGGNR